MLRVDGDQHEHGRPCPGLVYVDADKLSAVIRLWQHDCPILDAAGARNAVGHDGHGHHDGTMSAIAAADASGVRDVHAHRSSSPAAPSPLGLVAATRDALVRLSRHVAVLTVAVRPARSRVRWAARVATPNVSIRVSSSRRVDDAGTTARPQSRMASALAAIRAFALFVRCRAFASWLTPTVSCDEGYRVASDGLSCVATR